MISLILDTETTGKADFRVCPSAGGQPRVVQLGALLVDDGGKELQSLNLIVRPEGFKIPEEASNIHGITTEHALKFGVPLQFAVYAFAGLAAVADQYIGHNSDYDVFVMQGESMRVSVDWRRRAQFCTMKAMTPVCKLPGMRGDFKWPKLQEAFKHAFGREFDGAHDAMADVRAARDLYFWLRDRKAVGCD